ncbi:hypothetical protein E2P81_ATG00314 [Venturia nashicola]|nr:hypothetical protein E2P81_ATG00314 [Venturia nashicola]
MCYHETLTFHTCSHKVKTISICPCYLRHESKILGPPSARCTGEGTAYLPYAECRNLLHERFVVMALCPECNEEEKKRYGYSVRALGRSQYIGYELGRDAFYTEEGRDGMGDRRWKKRGIGNGELRRRGFGGVDWRVDDEGYGRGWGREGRKEDRRERYEGREERFKERHEERDGHEDIRYEVDERYYAGDSQYHDGNDRYEVPERDCNPQDETRDLPTQILCVNKQLQAEATQVIIENHTIKLGYRNFLLTQELLQPRTSMLYAPHLDIKVILTTQSRQLAAFLVHHRNLKDLHICFDIFAETDADLLECYEPYHLLPSGRLRLPGKVESGCRVLSPSTRKLNHQKLVAAKNMFRKFLVALQERLKGQTSVDDPTPLIEGQDMSRLID